MKQNYKKAVEALNKKLAKYLKKEGLTSLNVNVSEKQLEKLFFSFTEDFINYQLSFDDFSSLCEELSKVFWNKKNTHNSDLFSICDLGFELSWYIRNEPARAAEFLETMLDYYHENNSLKKK